MKKKYILISLIIFMFLLISAVVFYIARINMVKPIFVGLDKENSNTIDVVVTKQDVLSSYKDEGVTLKRGNKTIDKSDYKVSSKGTVDTSTLGTYEILYTIKYSYRTINVKKIVEVVDREAPELTINVDEVDRDFCSKKVKQNIVYSAIDNYDGDITSNVTVEEGEDKLIYSVTDSSGNTATKEVNINYGKKPGNKFYVNGANPTHVIVNTEYQDKGASYTDGCGKSINKEIITTGFVDTSVEGKYYLNYDVEGEATITREVIVEHYTPKTIYLTFDDGPGANTVKVLNALDKYNVKATFFVTNQFSRYQYLIAEEYNKGHKIGVHTLTHKWSVYDSLDAYIDDFNQMNEIVKNQTGSYTNIFRFPGGSGNTVSRSHKIGVVTEIANELTNRGYVYFDWNLSSGDADGKNVSTNKIISNVLNRVNKCSAHCVILFHDYKATTADAIEPILAELTSRGYTFATLSENSPTVHAKILN